MKVGIFGCRGSTPTPGIEFVRYGGETSCVALSSDEGPPRLLLDAGTGLRHLTDLLGDEPFQGTILLSHLHWDHTHGLPFASSVDRDDARVNLYLPAQDADAEELLGRVLGPPHFPIRPNGLRGCWQFDEIDEGEHEMDRFQVLAREIPHKGGRTFGYRVSDASSSIAYLPDHHPGQPGSGPSGLGHLHPAALELAADVDLLIHDANSPPRSIQSEVGSHTPPPNTPSSWPQRRRPKPFFCSITTRHVPIRKSTSSSKPSNQPPSPSAPPSKERQLSSVHEPRRDEPGGRHTPTSGASYSTLCNVWPNVDPTGPSGRTASRDPHGALFGSRGSLPNRRLPRLAAGGIHHRRGRPRGRWALDMSRAFAVPAPRTSPA